MRIRLIPLFLLLSACATPAQPTALTAVIPSATALPPTASMVPATATATDLPAATATTVPPTPTQVAIPDFSAATVSTLAILEAGTGGVTVNAQGLIFVADIGPKPRRGGETVYQISPQGEVSVFVRGKGLKGASGNFIDAAGNLFQSNFTEETISLITRDGQVSTYAEQGIVGPIGVVAHSDGTVYVANCRADRIQKITPDGESTVYSKGSLFKCPNGLTIDEHGVLYVANFADGKVLQVNLDGEVSEIAELPGGNNGHLVYHEGLLYVLDRGGHQVFVVTPDGRTQLIAGTGERGLEDGPALMASFSLPNGIGISPDGSRLYLNHVEPLEGTENDPTVVRVIELFP
jgi:sugar lactone lactonase YvrE